MKIGILYVKGALPLFEDFGNLPTHIVNEYGMVNGVKAHKALNGLIIPGGSIMESDSIGSEIRAEIYEMARNGSFILGMCSGFQLLSNKTDIGRRSSCPIEKDGLGILDVSFRPMISNDRVEAEIVDESFLTQGLVNSNITGFHCHTYGDVKGGAIPLCYSMIKRIDYTNNPRKILSGVKNDDGNVVGIMIHASLDENKSLVQNILNFMDANENDIKNIYNANTELMRKLKREIGVNTGINADNKIKSFKLSTESNRSPKVIMIASTGSDSGKTFITTGIVGVLRKKGYKTCVLKVGPDIRDIVPSLYLNKERMENFSSIKIAGLGWKDLETVLKDVKLQNYDIILVEGVMSIFTGMLNNKVPYSSAEIALAGNIPVLLVSACNKGGIETAAIDIVGHLKIMSKLGIEVKGAILNKVYDKKIADIAQNYIKRETDLEFIEQIPKIKIEERGNTPEVELKLDEFCLNAMDTVNKFLNVDKIVEMADYPKFIGYTDHETVLNKFK
ncbi:MAG: AAA family ATPase [Methanobacterium sp.]|jgi:cobyric acid synthase